MVVETQVILTKYEADLSGLEQSVSKYEQQLGKAEKSADKLTGSEKALSAQTGDLSTKFSAVQNSSKAAAKGIDTVGASTSKGTGLVKVFGNELNKVFPLFGRVASAARAMGSAITLALGPVGLVIAGIVAAFAALVKVFTGTQAGADALQRVMQPLKAIFETLIGIVQRFATGIIRAFSDPQQAVKDLWEAIKVNIANRIEGLINQFRALGKVIDGVFSLDFDQITEGAKEFGEAFIQTATGVEDAIGKASAAMRGFSDEIGAAADRGARIAEIDVELRKLALNRAENEGRINRELQEQLALTQDVTKSAAERQAAGDRFKELQRELTGFEQRRLDLEIERAKLAAENNDTLDEEFIRIAELVSAKEQAIADETAANRRVNNQLNTLNKQATDRAIAERKRLADERRKAEEEELKAAQARADAIAAAEARITDITGAQAEERFQRSLDEQALAERIIELRYQKEVDAARDAFDKLRELSEGNAEAIEEINAREAEVVNAIRANQNEELVASVNARNEAINEAERAAEEERLKQLEEEQEKRLEIFNRAADQVSVAIEGLAAGQEDAAKSAAKALINVALDAAEAQAQIAAASALALSLAQPDSVATFGASGAVRGAIIAALIKAAFAGLKGLVSRIGRKDGESYVSGNALWSGTDGHPRLLDKGERVVRTKTNVKYFPLLEMMEKGTFDNWVSSLTGDSVTSAGSASTTSPFSDRRLVGALGGVGSVAEQRKQTALLAMVAKGLSGGRNKRYRA